MKEIHGRLIEYENRMYRINHKREFVAVDQLDVQDVEACFVFSYEMAFGDGKHRNKRSGGDKRRKPGEIFIDTFQGKLAEFAIYRYFRKWGIETTAPDLSIEGLGVWDSFDIEFENLHIAVKSTKFYGNLLLLETKDWNENGEYIPNMDAGEIKYDFFVLLRIAPDGEAKMKEKSMLYSERINKKELGDLVQSVKWEYDIAGFITNKDFVRLIKMGYILPKGAVLNDTVVMDAENYYVQAGDIRESEELVRYLRYMKQFSKISSAD